MDIKNNIWAEKYRPRKLEDLILNESAAKQINGIVQNQLATHLLLEGSAGIGKSSLAKIIVNDILKCQHLYINASDESGIDTIRNKVTNFARTKSIDGNIKVIILDEADGITGGGLRALRNTMEEYSAHTRFILTANYKHRIIEPILSRVQEISLNPPLQDIVKRCHNILKAENVVISDKEKIKFVELVQSFYPDIRRTINALQKFSVDGELVIDDNANLDSIASKIYDQLHDPISLRKFVISHEVDFQNDYEALLKSVLNVIYDEEISDSKKQAAVLIIAEHLYKNNFVSDTEINFTACMINLSEIIH